MSKRKSLPQIDDLINPSSQHSPSPPPFPPQTKPQENKQSSLQVVKKAEKPKKEQMTIYVDSEMSFRLEAAQLQLRRITGKKGYATSRSAIVELALQMALNDLEANGANSTLASLIVRK